MKRLLLGLLLLGIAGFTFSLEIQIPLYFVHANNFLSGTMSATYNYLPITKITHDENVFGAGVGTGVDLYFNSRIKWLGIGLYFRFNYYNPYYAKASNMKIESIAGTSMPISDGERKINNSFSLDTAIGGIVCFKYKRFEFPLAYAWVFRVSKIDMESEELGKEGIVDFGGLFDIGIRYFFADRFFVAAGGRYGIGAAIGGFPDAQLPSGANIFDEFAPSQIVAGYAGIGIKL
jgi:hypothetical protein